MKYAAFVLICATLSCQRINPPVPTPTASPPAVAEPVVEIKDQREVTLDPGIMMTTWTLRASGVQELTARLLVIKDGKSEVAQEVKAIWEKWPAGKAVSWELYYVLQDGDAFGAKAKLLPSMTLEFGDPTPMSRVAKRSPQFLDGKFQSKLTESRKDGTIVTGRSEVLHSALYVPRAGSFSVGRTVESLVEASKEGRTAVAIVVEWKPVSGSPELPAK